MIHEKNGNENQNYALGNELQLTKFLVDFATGLSSFINIKICCFFSCAACASLVHIIRAMRAMTIENHEHTHMTYPISIQLSKIKFHEKLQEKNNIDPCKLRNRKPDCRPKLKSTTFDTCTIGYTLARSCILHTFHSDHLGACI